ncbi:MAG: hypothetical protein IKN54_02360 [Lachnospiraceae bacterium]|nr:hypothetical protein [Lachnospiraceae bacterium]
MENVRWATPLFRADAAKVRDELVDLANTNEYQNVKPQEIVDYAKEHPDSELHKCFEWDDTKAAASWRRQQARNIVCNLVITVEAGNKNEPTVARTLIITESERGQAYKPIEYILPDEYQRTLAKAWEEAKAWAKRYRNLKDSGIQAVIEQILA